MAVNGTCLTVVHIDDDLLSFDIIGETLKKTNLGELREGSVANFERSARVGDEIGGHNVSGHVQTTARVQKVDVTENNQRWQFQVQDASFMKYILAKGFIGVNGCSLTVGEVGADWFSVYLIPETLRVTTFGLMKEGSTVNIEVDYQTQVIVNTVERVLEQRLGPGAGAPLKL